jgi:hypothetical protein
MLPPVGIAAFMGFSLQSTHNAGEWRGLLTCRPLLRRLDHRTSTATSRSVDAPIGNRRSALPLIERRLQGVGPPGVVRRFDGALDAIEGCISHGIFPLQGLFWRTAALELERLLPRAFTARTA